MMSNWKDVILTPESNIREAMRILDETALRIAIVCDDNNKLLGTVTDGDIRRGLLKSCDMQDSVTAVMNKNPKTIKQAHTRQQRIEIFDRYDLLALPIVDNQNYLVGLETLHQVLQPEKRDNPVFIMAGGFGTRLRPLTDNCPKPMLRVGDKPMLEHLINQFRALGFHDFYISTHYMPEVIQEHFGDGSQWNINITYVHEDSPLGTGGALGLLPKDLPELPLIMMNGDVLTKINFDELLDHHQSNGLDATMCVRELEYKISYGVVESDNGLITNMMEKPTYRYHINTGIYVLSPECVLSVQPNTEIDLPTLLKQRMDMNKKVGIYATHEYWLDIGQMTDYQKAQEDIKGFYK
ncbi:nucleotidyltransferase family protein [Psychrobacter sanguinis]|uniref:nucleotidyltransferase family protein n=1 Tax=Psychrobacter sanguinis TaxID=861445 RepID=UPI00020C7A23|nr:nucleotidyltransferase family protein [Psychrobacter sanguinis]EGK13931.1 nucleotidyltransferase [Psychrobacter sp. 1501(2011)]MCD9150528.1 nucleotidyltransferase family protein [Psychrobacter sanguinis]